MKNLLEKLTKSLKKQDLTAEEAYTLTKYGKIMSKDDILKHLTNGIEDDIKLKVREGKYSLSIDITSQNEEFISEIEGHFVRKNFKVYVINEKVFPDLPDRGNLLITWKNQHNLMRAE